MEGATSVEFYRILYIFTRKSSNGALNLTVTSVQICLFYKVPKKMKNLLQFA